MKGKVKLIDWIICDDLRREDNGKLIFIGVYINTIVVPVVPFTLPQLVLFSKWDIGSGKIKAFECSIFAPEGTVCAKIAATVEGENKANKNFILQFRIAPFKFETTGKYKIAFTVDGTKVDAGSFDVCLREQQIGVQ